METENHVRDHQAKGAKLTSLNLECVHLEKAASGLTRQLRQWHGATAAFGGPKVPGDRAYQSVTYTSHPSATWCLSRENLSRVVRRSSENLTRVVSIIRDLHQVLASCCKARIMIVLLSFQF